MRILTQKDEPLPGLVDQEDSFRRIVRKDLERIDEELERIDEEMAALRRQIDPKAALDDAQPQGTLKRSA